MLPILLVTQDGKERRPSDFEEPIVQQFAMSSEEVEERLPSGTQTVLYNRLTWAIVYLVKAGLLERPRRGIVRITDRGRSALSQRPTKIDANFLAQYEEFVEFKTPARTPDDHGSVEDKRVSIDDERTPYEQIETAHKQLVEQLATELLAQIHACSPEFFERLVIDLLVAMGYGGSRSDAARAIGRSGDGGIDGIINEDRLGLDSICVQAKRWQDTVGRPVVQAFAGSLEGARARKGVVITTSQFADTAREYVKMIEKRIILIDGKTLAKLMIEHNVGVTTESTYAVKRLDSDYFEPES